MKPNHKCDPARMALLYIRQQFICITLNLTFTVIEVKDNTITVQEVNLDGITITFQDAKKDWQSKSYTLDQLRSMYGGVVFANPK